MSENEHSSSDMEHPDHGDIKEIVMNDRIHDNERKLFCERCHHYADTLDAFDDIDCDHYESVHENITGEIERSVDTSTEQMRADQ